MIHQNQIEQIKQHAYIPEHLPSYVTAISQVEPFLLGDFLVYIKNDLLIFVGYPLKGSLDEKRMNMVLEESIHRFHPKTVSLIAFSILFSHKGCLRYSTDYYYQLDLTHFTLSQKNRNMIQRASRNLFVEKKRNYGAEHESIVEGFMKVHSLEEESKWIFKRLKAYLSSSMESWIFEARDDKGNLVAFDVAEFGANEYSFYMFHFRSPSPYVPGASDLLLYEIIKMAKSENKRFINLGLGINSGVTFFKKKWGGVPFLPYVYCLYTPSSAKGEMIKALFQKL